MAQPDGAPPWEESARRPNSARALRVGVGLAGPGQSYNASAPCGSGSRRRRWTATTARGVAATASRTGWRTRVGRVRRDPEADPYCRARSSGRRRLSVSGRPRGVKRPASTARVRPSRAWTRVAPLTDTGRRALAIVMDLDGHRSAVIVAQVAGNLVMPPPLRTASCARWKAVGSRSARSTTTRTQWSSSPRRPAGTRSTPSSAGQPRRRARCGRARRSAWPAWAGARRSWR